VTNIRNFFSGFVEVANGFASILSLGYLVPGWGFRYYCWRTLDKLGVFAIQTLVDNPS